MFISIENEHFSACVNHEGAELSSFISKADGCEHLWQGNPEIWYGQSPILFPFVGQLLDGKFRYNGQEYKMPKHGFARRKTFKLKDCSSSSVTFSLSGDESTKEIYPFEFELLVTYEMTESGLLATHEVINKSSGSMFFSIGAHPGFNCEIGDIIEFEKAETLSTDQVDSNSIVIKEKFPVLNNERNIEITKSLFNSDALIFERPQSSFVTLKRKSCKDLKFTFGKLPFLGIWAKPAAPYVCLEPWFGVNDSYDRKEDVSQKRGIQELKKGEIFKFSWTVEVV